MLTEQHECLQGGMFGYSGDHPPGDVEGHMDFIKSLRQPDVWEVGSFCRSRHGPIASDSFQKAHCVFVRHHSEVKEDAPILICLNESQHA